MVNSEFSSSEGFRQGRIPSEAELFWVAGILEGEGSFMMIKSWVSGKAYLYPKIVVTMTDRDIIERVAVLFGNSVYDVPPEKKFPGRKYQYRAQISGAPAAELMLLLLPIMGARRGKRIREILMEFDTLEPTNVRRARSVSFAKQQNTR